MLSYNDALSHLLYGREVSELSADDRMLIANIVTLAGATAGGAVDGSAGPGSGAFAGRTEVENNYLSSTEKSRQTYLNNKQNLTPEEQKDKERLNRKDLESDLAVYAACSGTGADCQAERAKAKAAQDTYFNQTYQNPKEAQAGYQQIVNLLNSTDPNAKEVFNILKGYTQAFISFGYTPDEAKARAGAYVGSMYIANGVSAVVASGALAKQFGNDVALSNKVSTGAASSLVKNADGIYEIKINSTPLEGHNRLNTPVLGDNGKLKPAEAASAAQLEPVLGTMERYTPPPGIITDKTPDFVITSGPNNGKSVDAMYTTDRLSQKEIDGLNKFFEKNMSSGSGQKVIQDHMQKADFVPVDFRVLTSANQNVFMNYIKTLPKA